MKKLLLTAVLGLVLGAGAWKAQNPEGTIDDFRTQASSTLTRVKNGADAGIQSIRDSNPLMSSAKQDELQNREQELEDRLTVIEQGLSELDSKSRDDKSKDEVAESVNAVSESVNTVSESVNTVSESVNSLETSLQKTDMAVQEAEAGNQASVVRLDAIDSRLELLVRRLDEQTVEDDLQGLSENVASVEKDIQQLRATTSGSETSLSDSLANVNERTANLALRLNTLSASSSAAATDNDDEEQAADDNSQSALASLAKGMDERFNALEQRLSTVNSDSRRIATLTEQLDAAREQISQLQEQNSDSQRTLRQLNRSVENLKTAGESLSIDTVQAEIRDQLALVQSQFESNAAVDDTSALESLLESTRVQITDLEQRVQELPASSSEADAAQETQSALESQIADLESRLETLNTADPELVSTLSDVQEQVDKLNSKEFVTQDDLRASAETRAVEYKIYFDRNSAEITDAAAAVLRSFITQEQNRTSGVSIFGFTDRRGSATYNQQLALQRATNVRSYLIQNGLDFKKIKALNGLGEDAAAAVLPDNADDAQQRVVVLYAAQP